MNKLLKILILIIMITGCSVSKDKVLLSLDKVKKIAYYRDVEIQDFTDYAKYNVSLEKMDNNKYFKKMNNELKEDFLEYINDYEKLC